MKSMISKSLIMLSLSFPASRGGSLPLSTYSLMYRFNVSSLPRMPVCRSRSTLVPSSRSNVWRAWDCSCSERAVRGHEPGEQVHVVKGHASGAMRIGAFHITGDLVAFRHFPVLRSSERIGKFGHRYHFLFRVRIRPLFAHRVFLVHRRGIAITRYRLLPMTASLDASSCASAGFCLYRETGGRTPVSPPFKDAARVDILLYA